MTFASALFRRAGCSEDKASLLGELLVEADMMGRTTHGLSLAVEYLEELTAGRMQPTGSPQVLAERGAVTVWDGGYLPGVWLAAKALDLACERARRYGLGAVSVQRSHHIACLSVYLPRATAKGLFALIVSSDPSAASVAPFGGSRPVFTPNPLAVGIPTGGDPILIDMSASITTNAMSARLQAEGKRFPGQWAIDAAGNLTDDPAVLFVDPPGSILPAGGLDHGHKGYGLALLVEALTQGLSGYGRADWPEQWGASIFVLAIDPESFAGLTAFRRQMDWLVLACQDTAPLQGGDSVRMPGQAGLARRRASLREGVALPPGVMEKLTPWASRFDVPLPSRRV
ncbi:MAG: Ldh family oxidoreductase [Chloroflexi bacterium]|nr:Ldh family oxidoreductase [Chloroflexota bacterium]